MSRPLLDTQAFIWFSEDDPHSPVALREQIEASDTIYVSIASLWEIAIKLSIGKLALQRDYATIAARFTAADISLLPISLADTLQVSNLPLHHRDPFDRIIIAQAINHDLTLISRDEQFDAYAVIAAYCKQRLMAPFTVEGVCN